MLKEINSSKDVITNVDLFNEIIELVKNSKDTALMKCEGELPREYREKILVSRKD